MINDVLVARLQRAIDMATYQLWSTEESEYPGTPRAWVEVEWENLTEDLATLLGLTDYRPPNPFTEEEIAHGRAIRDAMFGALDRVDAEWAGRFDPAS